MEYGDFRIGDRVIGVGTVDGLEIDGYTGTIIRNDDDPWFLVKFDERFSHLLHSEDGMCWNVTLYNLVKVQEESIYEFDINYDMLKSILD